MRVIGSAFQTVLALSAALIFSFASEALAADHLLEPKLLDEVRMGASGSIHSAYSSESGVFPTLTIFFDPLDRAAAEGWKDIMLRPRLHAGAIISTSGDASQLYAGFTWTVDVTDRIFLDIGFGGALNNAELSKASPDSQKPAVGCHVLFHESLSAGYKLTENWRILATVEHSSNADLCDDNNGLTYAGLGIGYKF